MHEGGGVLVKEIKLRVEAPVKKKIQSMAKHKKMSMNEFLGTHLRTIATTSTVLSNDKRRLEDVAVAHTNLLNHIQQTNIEIVERLSHIEERLQKISEGNV